MEVILLKDVKGLGKKEKVKVYLMVMLKTF